MLPCCTHDTFAMLPSTLLGSGSLPPPAPHVPWMTHQGVKVDSSISPAFSPPRRPARRARGAMALSALSDDEQGILFVQLCNVLDPGIAVALSSCLLYTSPSPRDGLLSRMPSSA